MDREQLISFYRKHPVTAAEDLLHQELAPFQKIMLSLAWFNKFCFWIACRGAGKSHMLGIFTVLRGLLFPDRPVILTAGIFRQAKHTFTDEVETIIDGSVACKRSVKKISHWNDQYTAIFKNKSKIIAIPLGKGTREGEGASGFHGSLVIDEFWRIPEETFDAILFPFLGVSRNPIERMRLLQQKKSTSSVDNSLLAASTAYYQFNHLYKRWTEQLKKIKASKNYKVLIPGKAITGGNKAAVNFTWKDLPKGFLDDEVIKDAQDEPESFAMMYNNEFKSDTVGPYKRSLLENLRFIKPYDVLLRGRPGREYVVGVDVASSQDKFAIVVIEIGSDHHRIVYAFNRGKMTVQDMNLKIRQILYRFNTLFLVIDAGGGGIALRDLLAEELITIEKNVITEPIVETDSEIIEGRHILTLKSSDNFWLDHTNSSLLGSLQQGVILLPSAEIQYSKTIENRQKEIIAKNIDTLIDQFCAIRIKSTAGGAARWDTQNPNRLKDLYSATLFAYWKLHEYIRGKKEDERQQKRKRRSDLPRIRTFTSSPYKIHSLVGVN